MIHTWFWESVCSVKNSRLTGKRAITCCISVVSLVWSFVNDGIGKDVMMMEQKTGNKSAASWKSDVVQVGRQRWSHFEKPRLTWPPAVQSLLNENCFSPIKCHRSFVPGAFVWNVLVLNSKKVKGDICLGYWGSGCFQRLSVWGVGLKPDTGSDSLPSALFTGNTSCVSQEQRFT